MLILADKHSAPVTHLGQRIIWTVVVLAAIGGIYWLMWRGWKKRQARQADIPDLPQPPANGFRMGDGPEALYISTTSEGDWLDRIAVHRLGERSKAQIETANAGILINREPFGAPEIFIPAESVRGVRLVTGMAGKYLRDENIVVITWQHAERTFDTGIKFLDQDRDSMVSILEGYVTGSVRSTTERPSA